MAENINTVIGKDARIEGLLDVSGHLRIDGQVKGQVKCAESTTIGPEGKVEADINTKAAIIAGHVSGKINATEKTELQAKSVVNGDIKTKSLVVEQGAIFHGACIMKESQIKTEIPAPKK